MKEEKIAIVGSGEAGKTCYVSLSLACLCQLSFEKDAKYSLWTKNKENETAYLADYPRLMSRGVWPAKTQFKVEGLFHLEYDTIFSGLCLGRRSECRFRLIDINGDFCLKSTQSDPRAVEILNATKDVKYFMLMVDVSRLTEDEKQKDMIVGVADMLERRLSEGKEIYLAVVFTKCDLLSPPERDAGADELLKSFRSECATSASQMFTKTQKTINGFCVSCVSNPEHRQMDVAKGAVGNSLWSWEDMKDQLGPWKWIFGHMTSFTVSLW